MAPLFDSLAWTSHAGSEAPEDDWRLVASAILRSVDPESDHRQTAK